MTYLPHIQNQLREYISELCEACFAEQEWLEEGRFSDSNESTRLPSAKGAPLGSTGEESADAA